MKAPPFAGPDDRNWTTLEVLGDHEATSEWRTGADNVRRAAQRLAAGVWSIEQVLRDADVTAWVNRNAAEFIDAFKDEEAGLADLSDADFTAKMLLRVGQDLTKEAVPLGYYREDDDACASDAAYALDLPRWAKRQSWSAGGPGAGYDATAIVLAKGKTLEDLENWLQSRSARPRKKR